MLARIFSGANVGLDGVLIEVEVDVAGRGFPTFTIVGLPDKSVDEAKDRVRTAIVNAEFEMPDSRITVNLAPADIPKIGSGFDLPIAVGILTASGMINKETMENNFFVGELSLQGDVRRIPGVISLAMMAKKNRIKNLFLPFENAKEAMLVEGLTVYPVRSLPQLILHLNDQQPIVPQEPFSMDFENTQEKYEFDFSEIKGQEGAKRALEIAAAGFHNIHLKGPPGTGKTMLSRAFPSILPPMDRDEILEVSRIYSVAGLLNQSFFISSRPFRAPHHTTSRIGLIGGGSIPTPGEISLAHRGVLYLDELPEFPRSVLESLRQPLEDGVVTISRAAGSLTFPARFLLLASSNPCPCGFLGHPKKSCKCMPGAILRYKKRLSGPLLDRIDIHVDVPPVDDKKLTSDILSESSLLIKKRITVARQTQRKRFAGLSIKTNGQMNIVAIKKYCKLTNSSVDLLKEAITKLSLSARSYFKIIKIAQTITDLSKHETIEKEFVAEALQYRSKDD